MHPFLNLNLAISHPLSPLMSLLFTSPSGISGGQTRSTAAFKASVSKTKSTTLDFLVPRPSVRVCQAWCARMVKFVGKKAVVEGKGSLLLILFCLMFGVTERSCRSSKGLARRIVKDFTMNWPPKRRPFTSELGLKEKSDAGFVVAWSYLGFWCLSFCFLFLFFFSSFSPMVCGIDWFRWLLFLCDNKSI